MNKDGKIIMGDIENEFVEYCANCGNEVWRSKEQHELDFSEEEFWGKPCKFYCSDKCLSEMEKCICPPGQMSHTRKCMENGYSFYLKNDI